MDSSYNELSFQMVSDLFKYLIQAEPNCQVHALFLKTSPHNTEGPKVFCRGLGLPSWREAVTSATDKEEALRHMRKLSQLIYKVSTLATPMVAVMDGFVGGAATGLAIASEFQLATPNTVMAVEDLSQYLLPMGGLSHYLPRLRPGAGVGTWLALTGAVIESEDVVHCGLASHFAGDGGITDVMEFDLKERTNDLDRFTAVHAMLNEMTAGVDDTWLGNNLAMINETFSKDSLCEIVQELQVLCDGTGDSAVWAQKTLSALQLKSLPYLQLTLGILRASASKSMVQCLESEFRILQSVNDLPVPPPSNGERLWVDPSTADDAPIQELLGRVSAEDKMLLGLDARRGEAFPIRERGKSEFGDFHDWFVQQDPADAEELFTKDVM